MRIFFAGLEPRIADVGSTSIDDLYVRVGLNTGNLLFTNAVVTQLRYDHAGQARVFDPDAVNDEYDAVVIPAANWLFELWNFAWLADLVEKLTIPCVMVGVGAQAASTDHFPDLKEGTVRLMRAVSDRSALIGVRGEFSRAVLARYGIFNVEVIGCPSLYTYPEGLPAARSGDRLERVIVGGTRYKLPDAGSDVSHDRQRRLYEWGFRDRLDLLYQSERPEIDLIVTGDVGVISDDDGAQAASYYGAPSATEWTRFTLDHGNVFFDVDVWVAAMRDYSLYVGTRIHGAIASLLAGTPALLISHDSRTSELAALAGIPSVSIGRMDRPDRKWVRDVLASKDVDEPSRTVAGLVGRYRAFLDANGLEHKLEN